MYTGDNTISLVNKGTIMNLSRIIGRRELWKTKDIGILHYYTCANVSMYLFRKVVFGRNSS